MTPQTPPPGPTSVFGILSASARACAEATVDLGFGRSATVWRNSRDRLAYEHPEGHTLSLYLEGGTGTRRVDGTPLRGWPGALCVMPHGARSDWEMTGPFAFVHLYITADELRRTYTETFDRDARLLHMPEMTFADVPPVAAALQGVARAARTGDPLLGEAAMAQAVAHLLGDGRPGHRPVLRGGLAPHIRRRLVDHAEAHLGETLRLRDLAALVGLSEAHFQRAFRSSLGVSPHVWIAHRRAARAKALLRGPDPIASVALACGFSSQSHLTRAFKAATGVTPAAYRRMG